MPYADKERTVEYGRSEAHRRASHRWRSSRLEEVRAKERERQRERYKLSSDKILARQRTRHAENPGPRRLQSRLQGARRRSAEGTCNSEQWQARLAFYGFRCAYCLRQLGEETATLDHVIPLSDGGTNWPSNIVPACKDCNLRKGTKRLLPANLRRDN